jgi:hypothetical protein
VSRPPWLTYAMDSAVFVIGALIILKQAGLFFVPPEGGPSIELLAIGALCCNVPGILQVIQWRSGTASPPPPEVVSPSVPPAPPLSSAPSGGE